MTTFRFIQQRRRDLETLRRFYRRLYYFTDETRFWVEIGALRVAKKMMPLELPGF